MTTPFPFTSGQVLTAAQMNAITTLPINDQTDDYTLVVGDVGKRVIMNKGTANTVTVDDSIFAESDTIFIANKGAGTSTITAGAGVTINSASGLALVTSQSGQLIALSASSFLFVASDGPAAASGATLVKAQAVSGAATNVDNAFSATYLNYLLVAEFAGSTTATITMRLRASGSDDSTSNYFLGAEGRTNDGSDTTWANDGATSWTIGYTSTAVAARRNRQSFTVYAPQAATRTGISGTGTTARTTNIGIGGFFAGGEFAATTAFDGFSIIASAGTISGTVRVYGLADS